MEKRALIADDQYGGSLDTFFYHLLGFCVDSFTTCFSPTAGKLCVPIGLSAVSVLLLLLSSFLFVYQRCKYGTEKPAATSTFFYCFIGDLCGTAGAVLSRQLHIQILMGAFAAAVDAVNFVSCCLPVLLCKNSSTERRRRMMRKRRRQHLLAVCILMIIAGGFLKSRVGHYPSDGALIRRRLLHVSLQDNTEILGYVLGLVSFVIACSSRFPALCRPYRQQSSSWACVSSGLLCSAAGVLYAAALLLYDTHVSFLLRVLPWLLSAVCCVALDLLILVTHLCRWVRDTRRQPVGFSSDTECLLGNPGIPKEENTKAQVHSSVHTKNMAEMGRYMDVSSCPSRKVCLKEVTAAKEEGVDWFPDRTVRIIRVDGGFSSDTSCDSSFSSDLEWDFEEANAQWRDSTAKTQTGSKFPLIERPKHPRPLNTCGVFGLPQNTLSGTEAGGTVSAVSL